MAMYRDDQDQELSLHVNDDVEFVTFVAQFHDSAKGVTAEVSPTLNHAQAANLVMELQAILAKRAPHALADVKK